MLILDDFYVPFKYCDILSEIIIDPTLQEETDANYEVTLIDNLSRKENLITIKHLHNGKL